MIRIKRQPTRGRFANTTGAEPARRAGVLVAAVLGAASWPSPGTAHSMRDVETALAAAEPAASVVDDAAPDIVLAGRDGRDVRLADYRGRAIIVDLAHAGAARACAPNGGPIAKVRELVTQVPGLREQVQFITLTGNDPATATDAGKRCGPDSPGASDASVLRARPAHGDSVADLARAFGMTPGPAIGAVVVDPAGRIRARFRGDRFDPLQLMLFVAALTHAGHGPANAAPPRAGAFASTPPWAIGSAFALLGLAGYLVAETWKRRRRPGRDEPEQTRP